MTAAATVPRGCIIVGGKAWPCQSETRLWTDTKLEFRPGRGARKREKKVSLIVWHHTGGEGSAAQVHRTLNERFLGIEFIIDREGLIWQCCDPAYVDTFDAGSVNDISAGVEISSCGTPALAGMKGSDRGSYVATVQGRETVFARFYPAQVLAACNLAEALSLSLDIPRKFPASMSEMSAKKLDVFKGHVGHLHVKGKKIDPGTELFKAFRERGFNAV